MLLFKEKGPQLTSNNGDFIRVSVLYNGHDKRLFVIVFSGIIFPWGIIITTSSYHRMYGVKLDLFLGQSPGTGRVGHLSVNYIAGGRNLKYRSYRVTYVLLVLHHLS